MEELGGVVCLEKEKKRRDIVVSWGVIFWVKLVYLFYGKTVDNTYFGFRHKEIVDNKSVQDNIFDKNEII